MTEEGFTLVETLVALALGAMVVGAVLSTVKVASNAAHRAADAAASAEALARAGAVLQGDADHALYAGFLGRPMAMDLAQLPRDGSAPTKVAYRLEGARLTRDGLPLYQAPNLSFRYLGPAGWQSDWQGPGLPRAFALSEGAALILAAELPDLLPPACTRGPGPDCPLPSEAFR